MDLMLRTRQVALVLALPLAPIAAQGSAKKPPSAPPPATIPAKLAAILSGSALALQPGGATVATVEAPVRGTVVERRNGWSRVQVEFWVRDAALGDSLASAEITAAELRLQPGKYVGRTVDWTLQSLGVTTADELRPEMPQGQPYLLARGPLPETGFVYLMVPQDQAESFRKLPPLTKIRVRATIVAGKSRFLDTPVVELVRRLEDPPEGR